MTSPQHNEEGWIAEEALILKHAELHHYTNRKGLTGIVSTNTIHASHFSQLNDPNEVVHFKDAFKIIAESCCRRIVRRHMKDSRGVRVQILLAGGPTAYARSVSSRLCSTYFDISFERKLALTEPYISSFCTHSADRNYERKNGLLSQWRGYSVDPDAGRFSLVFDTKKMIELLKREFSAHHWVGISMHEAVYDDEECDLFASYPRLVEMLETVISKLLVGDKDIQCDMAQPFVNAATSLKHRAFKEEREVRIVAIPARPEAFGKAAKDMDQAKYKKTYEVPRRRIVLFEDFKTALPIRRIIVGPSARQSEDMELARQITKGRIEVVRSETPFSG